MAVRGAELLASLPPKGGNNPLNEREQYSNTFGARTPAAHNGTRQNDARTQTTAHAAAIRVRLGVGGRAGLKTHADNADNERSEQPGDANLPSPPFRVHVPSPVTDPLAPLPLPRPRGGRRASAATRRAAHSPGCNGSGPGAQSRRLARLGMTESPARPT
jgi:hypothetical protein